MSSFSRGLVHQLSVLPTRAPCGSRSTASLPSFILRIKPARPQPSRRCLSSTTVRNAVNSQAKVVAKPAPKPAAAAASAYSPAARTLFEQLAQRSSPTVLYEAPPHGWYKVGYYFAGVTCLGYAAYHWSTLVLSPPEGLAWWVPHAFNFVCVSMAAMGVYFVTRPARLIQAVRSLNPTQARALMGPKQLAATAASKTPLWLEVETGNVLPLMRPRKIYVDPKDFLLPARLAGFNINNAPEQLTGKAQMMAEMAKIEQRKKEVEYNKTHLLTTPFRDMGKGFRTAWNGIKRSMTREGLLIIRIANKDYRLDVFGGYTLENGRVIDRLCTINPRHAQ